MGSFLPVLAWTACSKPPPLKNEGMLVVITSEPPSSPLPLSTSQRLTTHVLLNTSPWRPSAFRTDSEAIATRERPLHGFRILAFVHRTLFHRWRKHSMSASGWLRTRAGWNRKDGLRKWLHTWPSLGSPMAGVNCSDSTGRGRAAKLTDNSSRPPWEPTNRTTHNFSLCMFVRVPPSLCRALVRLHGRQGATWTVWKLSK